MSRNGRPSGVTDSSTAKQVCDVAVNNVVYRWVLYAAMTYTPTSSGGYWLYTLYKNAGGSSGYTFFEAQNAYTGDMYRFDYVNNRWSKIANTFDTSGNVAADLNTVGAGVCYYASNKSTLNRPNNYGICLTFVFDSIRTQVALPNKGQNTAMKWRSYGNNVWSDWKNISEGLA